MRTTAEVLDNELHAFRAEQPDYVISDSVASWGKCVAELLGVPAITSVSTFAFNRHVLAFGLSRGVRPKSVRLVLSKIWHAAKALKVRRAIRRAHGIRGPGLMDTFFGYSGLNIVYTSRYFQPRVETFDERFHFIGPSMEPRNEPAPFPWDRVRSPVILYVSLGTLFNTEPAFYRACFEAFRDEDCQVILSTGADVCVENLGEIPANFIVQNYVPQLEVLSRATAFVTHGGMNSVSESLSHGVPVVVIPQMGEQAIVGRRTEQLGAGVYLPKSDATAESLRAAVRRVCRDAAYRERALLIGESFRSAGGVRRGADAVLAMAQAAGL